MYFWGIGELKKKYLSTKKPNDTFVWWLYRRIMSHNKLYVKHYNKRVYGYSTSYGKENPDKTFYIIRSEKNWGLMILYQHALKGIEYALSRGYIPVVDYSRDNMYQPHKRKGKNAWELFFKQPAGYSLKDIQRSKNIIMGSLHDEKFEKPYTKEWIDRYVPFVERIQFSDYAKEYLDEVYYKTVCGKENCRILGVLGRGTDYVTLSPNEHAVVPTPNQLIEIVNRKQLDWGEYDYIFLATEDENILNTFSDYYKEKLLFIEQKRYKTDTKGKTLSQMNQRDDLYKRGLEYLSAIYILSKCESLITCRVGGGLGASLFNKGQYERLYAIDMGSY